ncbi:succinate dehydrogenase/fumarate reductase cytochrome b subunit [Pseudodesulfovibrio thermohalotolerans]|uniref:succinate dehydrogenase/fumarate reductase cytochrome b subunit n=1 Tax=Pseudodesulfovibrio thermohalotolerans TaxID=2880651 RepID=UPI0022B9E824|nr:succinate dehydrogenase/fumarate reductase cytochrome b subunit [Pseudodesulfovibrio thermohalotolerans]WFS64320.1 succinate dehydrogenase/fumarate reductase cytochrome b subunit [Pseudodesulfovibrio thermohalotolerans]
MKTFTTSVPGVSLTDAALDWLQMLTGASLILFMWCHMLLVSSVVISPSVMNAIAGFFEATYMAQVGGPLIFLTFLVHFALAARKIPFRAEGQGTIWAHAKMLKHRDTWLWVVQAVTAMIILILGAIHMWVVLNDLPITAAKSAARMQHFWWFLFYMILLPSVELHVSVGFYRIAVKWGFVKSDQRKGFKRFETTLFTIFMVIGVITLIRFVTLG